MDKCKGNTQHNNVACEITNPQQEEDNEKTNEVYATIKETNLIATDIPGKFPITSKRGYKYMFVLYHYDSNAIIVRPMKNRSDEEFLRVYKDIIEYLKQKGLHPKIQRLDNEASDAYKQLIKEYNINYQLTPAQIHRRNLAERAIKTFKAHFIAILSGCDPSFPKNEWDLLLEQAEYTLNMLRTSRINQKLSAYEQLEGVFNFNVTPIAPLGIKTIAYEMPTHRRSWDEREKEG